jgi:SAM-dependent methyltransferase
MAAPLLQPTTRSSPRYPVRRAANRLLDTSSAQGLGIWHDVLTLQVDLFVRAEVAAFRESAAWRAAGSVLEAGCGNGRYLAELSRAFPDKRYLGIDQSDGLIELARGSGAERCTFRVADFLDGGTVGLFDAVIMRFVVQHLSDLARLLERTAAYLRPGGSLFIIEPDVGNSANTPATPKFDAMLAEFARIAASSGRLRVQLEQLPGLIAATPGWEMVRDEAITVRSHGPFVGGDLLRLYRSWIDLCHQQGSFPSEFDFAAARAELDQWAVRRGESRIGLRMLEVRRAREVQRRH